MRLRIVCMLLLCSLTFGTLTACENTSSKKNSHEVKTEAETESEEVKTESEEVKQKYAINDDVKAFVSKSSAMFDLQDADYVKVYDKSELKEDSGFVINIDSNDTKQEIHGFGASFTDTSAYVLMEMKEADRNEAMEYLFDDEKGIGLDLIRNCIGSADFALEYYTYDDMPEGQEDWELAHFDFSHDLEQIIPLTKQALKINPDAKVILSPWTAPLWMKTKYEWTGKSEAMLRRECYDVYARYLVKSVQAYEAAGVPVYAITPQNEMFAKVSWPGMIWDWESMATFINEYLRPAFDAEGMDTMILALDHNFEDHNEADSIMAATMNTVQGIAYHWYEGDPEEMLSTTEYFKNKLVYVTEAASSRKGTGSKLVQDSSKIVRELRSGASAHISWNIALGQDGGPTYNDVNLHNTGLLSCDLDKKEISYDVDYYILAHFSKFIHKGAVVLNSTDTGIDTDYGLVNVVTVNPNGSMTAVLVNSNKTNAQTCKLVLGDKVMEVTLEAKSIVTLTWDGNIQSEK